MKSTDADSWIVQPAEPVLVTGANGFVGSRVVDVLLRRGFSNIHCLVRRSSRLDHLGAVVDSHAASARIHIVAGDLTSRQDCLRVTSDVSVVYHLAAGFEKSFAGAFASSAVGTRNLLDALLVHQKIRRFVNVSSFAVYSNLALASGAVLDETCPLEDSPQERFDPYGFGKLKQEQIVRDYGRTHGIKFVVLRPGVVFGPGKTDLSGRVGIGSFGIFINVGGRNLLPLTYVDNCADAIVLAGLKAGVDDMTFNVVDNELLTSAQFLRAFKGRVRGFRSVRIPYVLAYSLCRAWEGYSRWSKHQLPPAFNRRRCAADWKRHQFPNNRIREALGWSPTIGLDEAMKRFVAQFPAE